MVIPHGVIARLQTGQADWLYNRKVIGPFPAIEGLETERIDGREIIVAGEETWQGQSIVDCQAFIDDWGLEAFKREAQHEVFDTDVQIFNPSWWDGDNRHNGNYEPIARYLFVDTAFKDKATHDPSAIAVVDLTPDYRLALVHMWNERVQSASLPQIIEGMAREFGGQGKITGVIIEDKGSGTTSIQTMRSSSPPWLAKVISEFSPVGSKEYRARNASVWCGRGCFLLPTPTADNSEWLTPLADPVLGQLFRFPNAPHDDMVDTITMSVLYLEHYLKQGWDLRLGRSKRKRSAQKYDDRVRRALKAGRNG